MFSYLIRRVVSGVVVLGIVSAIVFGIFFMYEGSVDVFIKREREIDKELQETQKN